MHPYPKPLRSRTCFDPCSIAYYILLYAVRSQPDIRQTFNPPAWVGGTRGARSGEMFGLPLMVKEVGRDLVFWVEVNTWLSKTYCRQYNCSLDRIAERVALELVKLAARETDGAEVRIVKGWRHKCGLEPRWLRIVAVVPEKSEWRKIKHLAVLGGEKWRLVVVRNGWSYVVFTDGCWDLRDVIRMLGG